MTVFLNKDKFYTVVDDKFYNVYLHDKNAEVKLLTAKNGKKYFRADLVLRRSKTGKFYFEAYVAQSKEA